MRPSLVLFWVSFVCLVPLNVPAATFTVTTTADYGAGSLRQAISDANASPGLDTIGFNIAGPGVQTITPFQSLPDITDPVIIDGSTQPGYAGSPLIELSGNTGVAAYGLKLTGGGSIVRALIINGFHVSTPGDGILLAGPGGNTIAGCWLGVDSTGTAKARNGSSDVHILNSSNNFVGGTTATDRNIISGNGAGSGIHIEGAASSQNLIEGNYIGLDPTGTANLGSFFSGVLIDGSPNNTVGGTTPGAGNVLSANGNEQVKITGTGASGNLVLGNLIGLKADGTRLSSSPAQGDGIRIDGASGNTIGGTTSSARNIIANNQYGIQIVGIGAQGNMVQGNYIGTTLDGSAALANASGVRISQGATGNLIGGTGAGTRNLISGNRNDGLTIDESSNNIVQGNFIGTDATGKAALGNTVVGSAGSGITISSLSTGAEGNLVGGTAPGARNIIAGNNDSGVVILGATAQKNTIQGNYIGLGADGTTVLGNVGVGVVVLAANTNLIGGLDTGAGNIIAGNGLLQKRPGIWLARLYGDLGNLPGAGNQVIQNTIAENGGAGVTMLGPNEISQNTYFANGGLDIDRGGDGPTANSPSSTSNYPELTSAVLGSVKVSGTLKGAPNCTYTVQVYDVSYAEIFLSLIIGPPGGKLDSYVGSFTVHTDSNGVANFQGVELPFAGQNGDGIMATAYSKDCGDGTSEMSPPVTVTAPTLGTFIDLELWEYHQKQNAGPLSIKVKRFGDTSGVSSVIVSTAAHESESYAGMAEPNLAYTPLEKLVTFLPGETEKVISIEIIDRHNYVGPKVFDVRLSAPSNAVLLSDLFTWNAVVIIDDYHQPPTAPKLVIRPGSDGTIVFQVNTPGPDQVVLQSKASLNPTNYPGWETAGFIPAGGTNVQFTPWPLDPIEFFLALQNPKVAAFFLELNATVQGLGIQLGKFGPSLTPEGLTNKIVVVPEGAISLGVSQVTSMINSNTGALLGTFVNTLDFPLSNIAAGAQIIASIKAAAFQVGNAASPPCLCTPWAGVVGGTVGGTQKVVIGGGANGQCDDTAIVHITGPGGVDVVLGPKEKRRTFDPAANGDWTVTSTVCGKTKEATITLP